jgi:hypothetical protein
MSSQIPGGVLVARSDGLGAGRFFGRSLHDPLTGGRALVGVAVLIVGERSALDFLFARDGGTATEVVRCHFDPSGRPHSCEVWHLSRQAPETTLDGTALAALLDADDGIRRLEVGEMGVSLQTATGSALVWQGLTTQSQ